MREWEKNFRVVEPYVPGEQPHQADMVKLNTNENPYPPAPEVKRACKAFDTNQLRLYSDYRSEKLVKRLAEHYGKKQSEVFVGVGSDDVLAMCFLTFFHGKKPVLFPDITYSFYKVWAQVYQVPYECQPLDEAFRIRKKDYFKENGGIIIANPNAPTSIYENLDTFRDILDRNQQSVVILDEAYIDFGGESALKLLDEYKNLLVVQTFSKSRSMAGIRIGYAIGDESLIKALNDVKYSVNSYTMNSTSIEIGSAAVLATDYYQDTIRKVIDTRERAKSELTRLGFSCLDSSTNFIFAYHERAKQIFEALKEKNIYVRHFDAPRIDHYLRITIGTEEQMQKLYEAVKEYLVNAR